MKFAPKPKNEKERLADLLALDLSNSKKKEQFESVILVLSECLKVPIAYISSIESEEQKIHSSCGLSFDASDRAISFCGHTILQKDILIVEDTLKDSRFFDNPIVINEPKIRFYAGFPLVSLKGYTFGSLCIADTVPRKLTKKQISIFKIIGNLLVEHIRLFKLGTIHEQINESQQTLSRLNNKLNKSNKFYEQLFGQYMSESLLNTILEDKEIAKLGGEQRFATILMSDLRGFTTLSEKHNPETIVDILNIYLDKMISIIHNHDGYINEILGDGILVVFGAPNHLYSCASKAVLCAQAMQDGLLEVNKDLEYKNLPQLSMGIGINSGEIIAGNIGSKKRMKYGVVGQNVNIAARIEALTVPGQILIAESTYNIVKSWINCIGNIRVSLKGIENPMNIYDVSKFNENINFK